MKERAKEFLSRLFRRLLVLAIFFLSIAFIQLDKGLDRKKFRRFDKQSGAVEVAEAKIMEVEELELDETQLKRWAREACELHRVPFNIYWQILRIETSNFNAEDVSPRGAIGVAQIMPANAKLCDLKVRDLFHPKKSIFCGAKLLRRFRDTTGDWFNAVAYYNGGYKSTDKESCHGGSITYTCTRNKETHKYLRKVFGGLE